MREFSAIELRGWGWGGDPHGSELLAASTYRASASSACTVRYLGSPAKLQYEPRVDILQHGYGVCAAKYGTLARMVPTKTPFLPQNLEPSHIPYRGASKREAHGARGEVVGRFLWARAGTLHRTMVVIERRRHAPKGREDAELGLQFNDSMTQPYI